jgi:hypothetical protein
MISGQRNLAGDDKRRRHAVTIKHTSMALKTHGKEKNKENKKKKFTSKSANIILAER